MQPQLAQQLCAYLCSIMPVLLRFNLDIKIQFIITAPKLYIFVQMPVCCWCVCVCLLHAISLSFGMRRWWLPWRAYFPLLLNIAAALRFDLSPNCGVVVDIWNLKQHSIMPIASHQLLPARRPTNRLKPQTCEICHLKCLWNGRFIVVFKMQAQPTSWLKCGWWRRIMFSPAFVHFLHCFVSWNHLKVLSTWSGGCSFCSVI